MIDLRKMIVASFFYLSFIFSSVFSDDPEQRALLQRNSRRCLGVNNNYGWCTHIARCPLPEFKKDRLRFMDYFCIIDRMYIGVCCPDIFLFQTQLGTTILGNPGALSPSTDFNSEQVDTNELPTIGPKPPVKSQPIKSNTGGMESIKPTVAPLPERKGCGLNEKQSVSRVVGGKEAEPKEWPWMAAVMRFPDIQFCGGCLITEKHILTAAHCVFKYKPEELYVRLGEHDFSRTEETRTQNVNVSSIRKHQNFDEVTYENDIAVLKILRAVTFNSYVWPVCLPEAGPLFTNQLAVVIGWGTLEYGGAVSDRLMEVGVPVWENSACENLYVQPIDETNLCAGGQSGKDSCQGDSGGPLLLQLESRRWIVIGVVSWGIKCGEDRPAVYTRVTKYLDWIFRSTL